MINIAVLVSGGGTNFQALIDAQKNGIIKTGKITLCISSNKKAYALERAEQNNIKSVVIRPKDFNSNDDFSNKLIITLKENNIDLVILAGYLCILSKEVTDTFKDRIINVHPSLIPSFCGEGFYGLHVHEQALKYGVKVTGATVHYVNSIVDGGNIILQKAVEIKSSDTPEILQRRVMEQAEWDILPKAAEIVCNKIIGKGVNVNMIKIADELKNNTYPGRGIVIGKSGDGENAVIAYFIMGRSVNSRNRIFAEKCNGIITQAFDPSKLTDPSLVIYAPVRVLGNTTIVTNGDQTDTVYEMMARGISFEDALRTRKFEPDEPNFTPRISGMLNGFDYRLSILKSANGNPTSEQRYFFDYKAPINGEGHFIHTYKCDGNPIPSFEGEPKLVEIKGDIDNFTNEIWESLNNDNKVSLFTRFINVATGKTETRIINKNSK